MRRPESRKGRSGFTLIELLVVVAIIALLISILLPSLARARELAKRTTCAANMSGIGKGLHTYASDGNQGMPIAACKPDSNSATPGVNEAVTYVAQIGCKRGTSGVPSDGETYDGTSGTGKLSTARNLWTLIRVGGSTPGSFVCPSSEDTKNDEDNPQDYWDFGKGNSNTETVAGDYKTNWAQVSYGYQVPYGSLGKPSNEGDQRAVLSADKGPWGAAMNGDGAKKDPNSNITLTTTSSPDEWRPFNSPNHGGIGDGEGQNVLYADSHADWSNKPTAGPAYDNIYTQWKSQTPTMIDRELGVPPVQWGANAGFSAGAANSTPLGNTDGLIYP